MLYVDKMICACLKWGITQQITDICVHSFKSSYYTKITANSNLLDSLNDKITVTENFNLNVFFSFLSRTLYKHESELSRKLELYHRNLLQQCRAWSSNTTRVWLNSMYCYVLFVFRCSYLTVNIMNERVLVWKKTNYRWPQWQTQ